MSLEVQQTRLPGVGIRYSFVSARGNRIAAILHAEGPSEIYLFAGANDEKPLTVLHLEEAEARTLGAILAGAYERPRIVEELALALDELAIEWIPVPDDSAAIGRTLAQCGFRARTRVTIIAILRDPEPVIGAQPADVIRAGDTLVAVGKRGSYGAFRTLLADGPFPVGHNGSPGEE
jgi:TrkA domain protein